MNMEQDQKSPLVCLMIAPGTGCQGHLTATESLDMNFLFSQMLTLHDRSCSSALMSPQCNHVPQQIVRERVMKDTS